MIAREYDWPRVNGGQLLKQAKSTEQKIVFMVYNNVVFSICEYRRDRYGYSYRL